MDVGMGNLHAENGHTDPLAGNSLTEGDGHLAGEGRQTGIGLLVQMEDIVILDMLGDDEGMALGQRSDVQEGIEVFVLRTFVGRDLAGGDPGEYRCHVTGKCQGS